MTIGAHVNACSTACRTFARRSADSACTFLLLANGWPSSFVEYLPIAAALADPVAPGGDPRDAFDVEIPAMPGYGFSDRPSRPNHVRALDLYHALMTTGLGYARFAVAGSHIGLGIATRMALEHPQSVTAIHPCGVAPPPAARRGAPFTADEERYLAAISASLIDLDDDLSEVAAGRDVCVR